MSTILVVDDQTELRTLFQRVLEHEGYQVVPASNGQEALRLLESGLYDLVLLDMAMPQMDGMSFLRLLRSRPECGHLPVIILSGMMTHEQIADARQLGVTDQLVKAEFSMRELRARVARQLSLRTPSVAATTAA